MTDPVACYNCECGVVCKLRIELNALLNEWMATRDGHMQAPDRLLRGCQEAVARDCRGYKERTR